MKEEVRGLRSVCSVLGRSAGRMDGPLTVFYYCLVMVYCVKYQRYMRQAAGDSARVLKKKEVYGLCTGKTVQIDIL